MASRRRQSAGAEAVHSAGETVPSASLSMPYGNCSLVGSILPKQIAYTTDNLQILSYLLSLDNLLSKTVTGQVNHFSRYAVAW